MILLDLILYISDCRFNIKSSMTNQPSKRRKRQGVWTKAVLVYLTPDVHEFLKQQAEDTGESVSSLVEIAVMAYRKEAA